MDSKVIDFYEKEAEEMTAMNFITGNDKFERTEGGFLNLKYDGRLYERVKVVRLFPFTDPDKYISIRENDERAKEIGIIENLTEFPGETVKLINEQLALNYYIPVIEKIKSIKDESGNAYFNVTTDRGDHEFVINMSSNPVTKLTDTRLIITDMEENRFEIRDIRKLSQKELRKLDLFL